MKPRMPPNGGNAKYSAAIKARDRQIRSCLGRKDYEGAVTQSRRALLEFGQNDGECAEGFGAYLVEALRCHVKQRVEHSLAQRSSSGPNVSEPGALEYLKESAKLCCEAIGSGKPSETVGDSVLDVDYIRDWVAESLEALGDSLDDTQQYQNAAKFYEYSLTSLKQSGEPADGELCVDMRHRLGAALSKIPAKRPAALVLFRKNEAILQQASKNRSPDFDTKSLPPTRKYIAFCLKVSGVANTKGKTTPPQKSSRSKEGENSRHSQAEPNTVSAAGQEEGQRSPVPIPPTPGTSSSDKRCSKSDSDETKEAVNASTDASNHERNTEAKDVSTSPQNADSAPGVEAKTAPKQPSPQPETNLRHRPTADPHAKSRQTQSSSSQGDHEDSGKRDRNENSLNRKADESTVPLTRLTNSRAGHHNEAEELNPSRPSPCADQSTKEYSTPGESSSDGPGHYSNEYEDRKTSNGPSSYNTNENGPFSSHAAEVVVAAETRAPREFTIGWICALSLEMAAATRMFDCTYAGVGQPEDDDNSYELGRIGNHNVVVAGLPTRRHGTVSAAVAAERMRWTFPSIKCILLVGVAGGAPCPKQHDVRLGDVVIGERGVMEYRRGRMLQDSKFEYTGFKCTPPQLLLKAITRLQANRQNGKNMMLRYVRETVTKFPRSTRDLKYPGVERDAIYCSKYHHADDDDKACANCDKTKVVTRPRRDNLDPVVHYGLIGSADLLVRDCELRDMLREKYGVLCLEMEGAGLVDEFKCLVIRGICDYCDSHKNKTWQPYAAVTAAAYAKELLSYVAWTSQP